jgi:hypothetical protein
MGSPKCVILNNEQAEASPKSRAYPEQTNADMYMGVSNFAIPDAKYEYGDATLNSVRQVDDAMNCGYGYGMVTPDFREDSQHSSHPKRGLPPRSSMKSSINSAGTHRRAASIGQMGGGGEFEVDLPGHPQPVRRRRAISFDENVAVCEVLPIKSFADNPESLWFQGEEMAYIQQQISSLVKDKIRYPEANDNSDSRRLESTANDDECCTRGLERMLQPERTKIQKFQAWDTVLNEQYLQRKDGEFDDESLADLYGQTTRRSQREAQRRASKDAEEVEAYVMPTQRLCRRISI